ncbi:MAG: hypothetical protein EBX52_03685 [Proteobacteria bacterium]|nr:hypothetical protein [Pseudomonadota bacterium]
MTVLMVLFSSESKALVPVPTLRMGLGYSPINFTAGSLFPESTSLGNILTVNPMFLWDFPGVRSRVGFHFLTDIGSPYSFVSTAGIGITGILYPFGISSGREVSEDFTETVKSRNGPFIHFSLTPTKFTVTQKPDPSSPIYNIPSLWPYFSVKVVEVAAGAGYDFKLANDLTGFGSVLYRTAAFKEMEAGAGAVSYGGLSFLVGVMTNFY